MVSDGKRKILVARVEHKAERGLRRDHGGHGEHQPSRSAAPIALRKSRGPSNSRNVGSARPDISALAQNKGEAVPAASNAPQRSQPPKP